MLKFLFIFVVRLLSCIEQCALVQVIMLMSTEAVSVVTLCSYVFYTRECATRVIPAILAENILSVTNEATQISADNEKSHFGLAGNW